MELTLEQKNQARELFLKIFDLQSKIKTNDILLQKVADTQNKLLNELSLLRTEEIEWRKNIANNANVDERVIISTLATYILSILDELEKSLEKNETNINH